MQTLWGANTSEIAQKKCDESPAASTKAVFYFRYDFPTQKFDVYDDKNEIGLGFAGFLVIMINGVNAWTDNDLYLQSGTKTGGRSRRKGGRN